MTRMPNAAQRRAVSAADAPDADDERRRPWKMHHRSRIIGVPHLPTLTIHVDMQSARKCEQVRHDVRRYAIGEYPSQIRDGDGMRNQLGMVVSGRRRRLR